MTGPATIVDELAATAAIDTGAKRPHRQRRWRPHTTVALVVFGAIVLLALLAPVFLTNDAQRIDIPASVQPPSWSHPFGTDQFGRDLLSRVAYGARPTLEIASLTTALVLLLGVPIGIVAGYVGGILDLALMRVVEMAFALPALILAIAIVSFVGHGVVNIVIALTIVYVPLMARVARAATLTMRRLPFIDAARAVGDSDTRIMFTQVAPNIAAPVGVQATLIFAFVILAEASLSFLGLGTQEPRPSWGLLVQDGLPLVTTAPWVGLFPGVFIALTVLSLNLISDGLRDVLDVAGRGRQRTRGGGDD